MDGNRAGEVEQCPGCGVRLPRVDGPTHAYMTCSASCWQRFGELLAAQYADPGRMAFHQLVVDAYAVQHPDGDDPRAIQSVAIHLMTLCLFLEEAVDPSLGAALHARMVRRPVFHRLEPPPSRGSLTVLNVPVVSDAATAREAAYAWARSAWDAWQQQHVTVREWLAVSGLNSRD